MKFSIRCILGLMALIVFFTMQAQQPLTKGDIIVKTSKSPHNGRVVLKEIENLREDTVVIRIINEYEKPGKREAVKELRPREKAHWDVTFNIIRARLKKTGDDVEIFKHSMESPSKDDKQKTQTVAPESNTKETKPIPSDGNLKTDKAAESVNEAIISGFNSYLNSIPYFSDSKYSSDSVVIYRHLTNLGIPSIDKSAYITDENIREFAREYNDSLKKYAADSTAVIYRYLTVNGIENHSESYMVPLNAAYRAQIEHRSALIKPLSTVLDGTDSTVFAKADWKQITVCGCVVLLCVALAVWYWRVSKKNSSKKKTERTTQAVDGGAPALVVVGSKTSMPLKKQNLDDVHDNELYIKIETSDFCEESLVSAIYIKNSCIKDIYNMYAEDLRLPDHPKEDGCMVIGRWILDEKSGKYEVSLEYPVMPGDDAVFAEYELNFGGKIKLRMSEKLRKLRRETGLQYDLTCWVHSHPGLGVFFSSSDNNVQHQLKHPIYPGFLTALVVDILTPTQEMGIFTFKDEESVNSKGDLKRMYSLEELYNTALQNERRSFDSNDYFDILSDAGNHLDSCYGIQLSNSAIIDMTFLTSKPNGFIGFAHGYTVKRGERTQCVVSVVNGNMSSPNTDRLGCFVMASHCSIPSIRKIVDPYLKEIHFVLVYTASNGLLTAIPVIDRDLTPSDAYYGEQELENLKIWTRRRR